MKDNIGSDLNLEDCFGVEELASLVDQKIANLLRNNVWRQKILTSPYSHADGDDEDGDPYSHEDDDPSWGVVELAGRVDKTHLIDTYIFCMFIILHILYDRVKKLFDWAGLVSQKVWEEATTK